MKKKICLLLYSAVHYRKKIYSLIDENYDCEFNFHLSPTMCEQFDTGLLNGQVNKYEIKSFKGLEYTGDILKKTREDFDTYIVGANPRNIAVWLFCIKIRLFHPQKRIFFWTHGWYGKESIMESLFKRIFYRLPHGIFLYGNYARNLMIERGFNPDKLFVIHNSLDYDKQLELRNKAYKTAVYYNHFQNEFPTIIFIGRLKPVKQLDLLIEAVDLLIKKGEKYNIVFVGDGPMKPILSEIAVQKGIESNVWFYGECYDESTNAELIYNAEICVAPGNVGLTAIHTLMFGTPVITHDNFPYQMPEFESINPGVTGDFFKQGDVQSLAETIQKWESQHINEREQIRNNCYLEIDTQWNPDFQINVIKKSLKGNEELS